MLEDLAKHDKLPEPAAPAEGEAAVTDVVSEEDKAAVGKYTKFYAEFGAVLKEGLGEDFANKERLAKLLRFASHHHRHGERVAGRLQGAHEGRPGRDLLHHRRHPGRRQEQPAARSVQEEGHRSAADDRPRGRVGAELPATSSTARRCSRVAKGAVDLGKLQDETEKKAAEEAAEAFKPLLAKLKEALKDKAEDVRVTTRLVDSPACLVVQDDGMSTQLARMLKQAGQAAPEVKPVLEVNAEHALVKKLDGSVHFNDLAHILFDQALLAEGGLPEDPAAYVKRVNALLA